MKNYTFQQEKNHKLCELQEYSWCGLGLQFWAEISAIEVLSVKKKKDEKIKNHISKVLSFVQLDGLY